MPGRSANVPQPRARLAVRPALSAAVAHLAVLGRQYRARPLHRRPYPADDACVHPLGRRVPDPAAVRRPPSACAIGRSSASMPALMTLLAFTGFSAYNTMAYYGLQYTTAINGLLLQSVGPLFVALWTFVLFGDRLTLRQAGGICVSLTGVVVIICHGSLAVLRRHRVQSRRCLVPDRAADLRLLHRAAAQAAGDPSVVVSRRRHGLGRGAARSRAWSWKSPAAGPWCSMPRACSASLSSASSRRCSAICSSIAASS